VLIPRHRFYSALLLSCGALLAALGVPPQLRWLSFVGYALLALLLLVGLGRPLSRGRVGLGDRVFFLLGLAVVLSQLIWSFTAAAHGGNAIHLLLLWAIFTFMSTSRLLRAMAQERQISQEVLQGAVAGYLLLGIAAGLLFSVLETTHPGSFTNIHDKNGRLLVALPDLAVPGRMVWELDFVGLNYFAFQCLTTVGFGDITPITTLAQMLSVAIAVAGPLYLAVVMGLLIARLTSSETREEKEETLGEIDGRR
jgi:hypothetical protein